jgi:hypothetical protein
MIAKASDFREAARSGIEMRKRRGILEPTTDDDLGDSRAKFFNLMVEFRNEIDRRNKAGTTGYLGSPFGHLYGRGTRT